VPTIQIAEHTQNVGAIDAMSICFFIFISSSTVMPNHALLPTGWVD
jgi:hypothetical protein